MACRYTYSFTRVLLVLDKCKLCGLYIHSYIKVEAALYVISGVRAKMNFHKRERESLRGNDCGYARRHGKHSEYSGGVILWHIDFAVSYVVVARARACSSNKNGEAV